MNSTLMPGPRFLQRSHQRACRIFFWTDGGDVQQLIVVLYVENDGAYVMVHYGSNMMRHVVAHSLGGRHHRITWSDNVNRRLHGSDEPDVPPCFAI